MAIELPEITSFGTLLRFAMALDRIAAERGAAAATAEACRGQRDALTAMARKHARRVEDLERLARERLNEVVLQPLSGMVRAEYLPPDPGTGGGAADLLRELATLEERSARFYGDAAERAVNVLGGLDRTFKRFAKEDQKRARALEALVQDAS